MSNFYVNKKRTDSGSSGSSGYGSSSSKSEPDSGQTAAFSLGCVRKKCKPLNFSLKSLAQRSSTSRSSTSSITPKPATLVDIDVCNLRPSSTPVPQRRTKPATLVVIDMFNRPSSTPVPQRTNIKMGIPPKVPHGQPRRKREDSPGFDQVLKKVSVCMVL